MAQPNPTATVERLSGSSYPGHGAPSFEPAATAPEPEPAEAPPTPDPVHAAIAQHRAAYAACDAASKGKVDMTKPEGEAEAAALQAVMDARPATLPGLSAWVDHVALVVERDDDWPNAKAALPRIALALRRLLSVAPFDMTAARQGVLATVSIKELIAMHEGCTAVRLVLLGVERQPRVKQPCRDLMEDWGDQVGEFEELLLEEAERRTPADSVERASRACLLASNAAHRENWTKVLHVVAEAV